LPCRSRPERSNTEPDGFRARPAAVRPERRPALRKSEETSVRHIELSETVIEFVAARGGILTIADGVYLVG
jgi:hypothetical protein